MDRHAVSKALTQRLEAEPGVVAAWVFGSVARGEAGPDSDVDVAILTSSPPAHTLADLRLELADDLSRQLGRRVDLVVVDRAPADLVHRVLRDGALIVDHDRVTRIRFEVAARNRYFDMLPIWRNLSFAARPRRVTDEDLIRSASRSWRRTSWS